MTTKEAEAIIMYKMNIKNLAMANTIITRQKYHILWPKDYTGEVIQEQYPYKIVAYAAKNAMERIPGFPGLAHSSYYLSSPQSGTEMGFGYVLHRDTFSFTFAVPQCVKNATIANRVENYAAGVGAMITATANLTPNTVIHVK